MNLLWQQQLSIKKLCVVKTRLNIWLFYSNLKFNFWTKFLIFKIIIYSEPARLKDFKNIQQSYFWLRDAKNIFKKLVRSESCRLAWFTVRITDCFSFHFNAFVLFLRTTLYVSDLSNYLSISEPILDNNFNCFACL